MFDTLRAALHEVLTTPRLDGVAPVRLSKGALRRLNLALGEPLASREALASRRAAHQRLLALRSPNARPAAPAARELAPVMVYFEKDRNVRELERMEEVLKARAIPYQRLDVAGDEAAMAFVVREARCKEDELPIVFVAGKAVGGFRDLVAFDAAGDLVRTVFGRPG